MSPVRARSAPPANSRVSVILTETLFYLEAVFIHLELRFYLKQFLILSFDLWRGLCRIIAGIINSQDLSQVAVLQETRQEGEWGGNARNVDLNCRGLLRPKVPNLYGFFVKLAKNQKNPLDASFFGKVYCGGLQLGYIGCSWAFGAINYIKFNTSAFSKRFESL